MSRFELYLQAVGVAPLLVFMLAMVIAVVVMSLIPSRLRLSIALVILPVWLLLGLLRSLEVVALFAKSTGFVIAAWVAWCAWSHDDPRNRLPKGAWVYWLFGLAGVLTVLLGPGPQVLPLIAKLQWLAVAVAAMLTARTIHDDESMRRVFRPLVLALAICTLVLLMPIFTGGGFKAGLNRYFPFKANPNQCGSYLALTFAFGLVAFQVGKAKYKPFSAVASSVALGLILLTRSRSILGIAVLSSVPAALRLLRRPVFLVPFVVVLLSAISLLLSRQEGGSLARFLSREDSNRLKVAQDFIDRIGESPVFGQMFRRYEVQSEAYGASGYAHNHYLEVLYEGGVIYFATLVPLLALTLYAGWRLAWNPQKWGFDPLMARTAFSVIAAAYVYGFASNNAFYGTTAYAFFTVLCGTICLRSLDPPPALIETTIPTPPARAGLERQPAEEPV